MSDQQHRAETAAAFWKRRYDEQHRTLHSCEDALAAVRAERDRLREDVGTLEGLVAQLQTALDRVIDDNTSARQALATIADQQSGVWGQIAHDAIIDKRRAGSGVSAPDTSPPEGSSSAHAP